MIKTLSITVLAIACFLSFLSSELPTENTRMVEGQVLDGLTQKPIKATVEFHRRGSAWHVRSGDSGWYYISLKADQAYAVKIMQEDFKYYTQAFYLAADSTKTPYKHNILLMPKKKDAKKLEDKATDDQ